MAADVSPLFGHLPVHVNHTDSASSGTHDIELAKARVAALDIAEHAVLDVVAPVPTAAFSRLDTHRPGSQEARERVAALGFQPVVRPVGGHLAAYDGGCVVLHLSVPHPDPHRDLEHRFRVFGECYAEALRSLGVDARLGPVPREYCPGRYTVNGGGRLKLIGTGQRVTRHGYLFSAVVMVTASPAIRAVLDVGYAALGRDYDPATLGGVDLWAPGVTREQVAAVLVEHLHSLLHVERGTPS